MKRALLLIFFLCVAHLCEFSQTAISPPVDQINGPIRQKPLGTIDVIVTGDDGKPLADAPVSISRFGVQGTPRGGSTDESGAYHVANLPVGVYHINVFVPGFIVSPESGSDEFRSYHTGETANIQLVSGGVITGTVTDRDGNPIVGITVAAVRVRESGDTNSVFGYGRPRQTDDRGIYRLYGLSPGKYIVFAGGRAEFGSSRTTPFDRDAPTFFPSSTRETASRVTVLQGQEYSGIDIRYRNEPGFQVSGTISGAAAKNVRLALTPLGKTEVVAGTGQFDQEDQRSFVFSGVPAGTYRLTARGSDEKFKSVAAGYVSTVKVQGIDVNGLDLRLSPLATISGRIVFDPAAQTKCERSPIGSESISLELRSEKRDGDDVFTILAPPNEISVSSQGEFQGSGVAAGKYRLQALLARNNLYVRSILRPGTASGATPPTVAGGPTDSFSFSSGERIGGLIVNIQQDGGSIGGSLSGLDGAPATPFGLHIYLVPAEKERVDDTLRYSELVPNADGGFLFPNLAPGKYFLTSRILLEPLNPARPLTWDTKQRAKLVDDAKAANVSVELKPCQAIRDYQLLVSADGSIKTK